MKNVQKMKNTVAERIADFLKRFPPFSSISFNDLYDIAVQSKVIYLEKNQILFKGGDATHTDFYVVNDGALGLSLTSDTEEMLIDKCDEGDIVGLRPFFAKNDYLMTAKAKEETIVYAIPIAVFQPYIAQNTKVLGFLLESFASQTRNPYEKGKSGKLVSENTVYSEQSSDIQYFQPIKYTKNPITANADDILKFIAKTMSNSAIGSVIIQENQLPIGIITDRDLRSKIATGLYPIDIDAKTVMTAPVLTVPENISVAEAQMLMLKHNVGHLCVTRDGTDKSPVSGIISEHDVVAAQANTPGVLLKQTRKSLSWKDLKHVREKLLDLVQNSIDKNIPISYVINIVAEISNAIMRKTIELVISKMIAPPPCRFMWINVGSQGRKEHLLLTAQKNALIFEDVEAEQLENTKSYFLELADETNKMLQKIGYEYPADYAIASNPQLCMPVSNWINQYSNWINIPSEKDIEKSVIFFDIDFVYGDSTIEDALTEHILGIEKNKKFFAYLATDALKNPPPLGFFRQFLVESDGEHKDAFDIKSRALEPLTDAARLLALHKNILEITGTYARYKKLAELEPQNAEIYDECADAFITLTRFRTEEGLLNNSNGKYLNLNELSKSDKVKLKNCFAPIGNVQDIIKNRFSLTSIN